ncbi:YdeI/OmpD-associated family protein [Nocardioides sp.]|uniref:YdeI/OmpD-associated family protein n=1 Tax=Nocardioides sp. TaxID=35761 RepID=UPI0026044518|nr:YdeI/OmpD-associated family protein [Nocardioides sp.]
MALSGEELLFPDAAAWRAWLEAHHADTAAVWLVLSRKGGTVTDLDYDAALDAALCFGWIDGQTRRRDEQTTFQRWTPRGPRSRWSARNVGHVARLEAAGLMQPAGRAAVAAAQADGRWEAAYAGPATAELPTEVLDAIAANPAAAATYATLTSQNRFALYHRYQALTTDAGRQRKIAAYVAMLERGETYYPQ